MTKSLSRAPDRVLWMDQRTRVKPVYRKSNLFVFFLPILFLIVSSLFFVWSRIQVIQLGYEISNALKEGRGLDEANKKLRLEIATLKSFSRIEKFAVEELRMVKPEPGQVIIIR